MERFMRFTVFNIDKQIYELHWSDDVVVELERSIQKLGLLEDVLEDYNINTIEELKERLG